MKGVFVRVQGLIVIVAILGCKAQNTPPTGPTPVAYKPAPVQGLPIGNVPIHAHDASLDLNLIGATEVLSADGRKVVGFKVPAKDQTLIVMSDAATNPGSSCDPASLTLSLMKAWTVTLSDHYAGHSVKITGSGKPNNDASSPITIVLTHPDDSFDKPSAGKYKLHDGEAGHNGHETFESIHIDYGVQTLDFKCPDQTKCALDVGQN